MRIQRLKVAATLLAVPMAGAFVTRAIAQSELHPRSMPAIAEVGQRFLSFNVEAVEVTGGRFWKPYKQEATTGQSTSTQAKTNQNQPAEMDPGLFQYRRPIDLSSPRLRKLASALAPSFVRVSGTWRNSTFFQDDDKPALETIPDGYKGVMTRAEWKGVLDFTQAVGAGLVTSVATSRGTRDANGVWTPAQAQALFDYTKSVGGNIDAIEFMNEPTFALIGGAPSSYNAAAFARDVKVFNAFLRKESPKTIFLGPGSVGEGAPMLEGMPAPKMIATDAMLQATGPVFDVFSYHFYGTISKRCTGMMGPKVGMTADQALSVAFFEKNVQVEEYYAGLRDKYMPGKAIWNTETGEAGCGGDPWASTFLDSFRFMDQLGTLAQKNVQAVMVNTLASSDYGLLDENTLEPRPNFWGALLWKRTMGTRVLDPGPSPSPNLRLYAQCMKGRKGGVTLLVLNLDRSVSETLHLPQVAKRFTLSAPDLASHTTLLNGNTLHAASDGSVPMMAGESIMAGATHFAPLTISFIEIPGAQNRACQK